MTKDLIKKFDERWQNKEKNISLLGDCPPLLKQSMIDLKVSCCFEKLICDSLPVEFAGLSTTHCARIFVQRWQPIETYSLALKYQNTKFHACIRAQRSRGAR